MPANLATSSIEKQQTTSDYDSDTSQTMRMHDGPKEFKPIPESLLKSIPKLYKERVTPVDLSFNTVREENYNMSIHKANRKAFKESSIVTGNGKANASICFVVRKPGCIICHEQGMILTELVESFSENQVAAWAVVKEINVDNEGLLSLYQNYFNFPFFLDSKMKLYKALGLRKLNLFKALKIGKLTKKRILNRGIQGTFFTKGEGLILGGVIIFDSKGEIKYAFEEKSGGQELPIQRIKDALHDVINNNDSTTSSK